MIVTKEQFQMIFRIWVLAFWRWNYYFCSDVRLPKEKFKYCMLTVLKSLPLPHSILASLYAGFKWNKMLYVCLRLLWSVFYYPEADCPVLWLTQPQGQVDLLAVGKVGCCWRLLCTGATGASSLFHLHLLVLCNLSYMK